MIVIVYLDGKDLSRILQVNLYPLAVIIVFCYPKSLYTFINHMSGAEIFKCGRCCYRFFIRQEHPVGETAFLSWNCRCIVRIITIFRIGIHPPIRIKKKWGTCRSFFPNSHSPKLPWIQNASTADRVRSLCFRARLHS